MGAQTITIVLEDAHSDTIGDGYGNGNGDGNGYGYGY